MQHIGGQMAACAAGVARTSPPAGPSAKLRPRASVGLHSIRALFRAQLKRCIEQAYTGEQQRRQLVGRGRALFARAVNPCSQVLTIALQAVERALQVVPLATLPPLDTPAAGAPHTTHTLQTADQQHAPRSSPPAAARSGAGRCRRRTHVRAPCRLARHPHNRLLPGPAACDRRRQLTRLHLRRAGTLCLPHLGAWVARWVRSRCFATAAAAASLPAQHNTLLPSLFPPRLPQFSSLNATCADGCVDFQAPFTDLAKSFGGEQVTFVNGKDDHLSEWLCRALAGAALGPTAMYARHADASAVGAVLPQRACAAAHYSFP